MIHRTQMMEDNVVLYDKQSGGAFVGERSRRRLGRGGDVVRG